MSDEDQQNVMSAVAELQTKYLDNAINDLQEKYANGDRSVETSVTAPTGSAYKSKIAQEKKNQKASSSSSSFSSDNQKSNALLDLADDDDMNDDDDGLRRLRDARKKQLLNEHQEKIENLSKGHGQYRDIVQDEFLKEVTSSKHVICHFYHRDFARCKIMDHHLNILAARHIESKFIKINAEKALFFVEKLIIRTIPTVVMFDDGLGTGKIVGFEGLSDNQPEGKEDEWSTATLARLIASQGFIKKELIVDTEADQARCVRYSYIFVYHTFNVNFIVFFFTNLSF